MVHARPRVLAHVLITDAVHVRCGVKQGSDQLQAKLDSLLAEARKTQAETMSEVHWRGRAVVAQVERLLAPPPARAASNEGCKRENFRAQR